MVLDTKTKKRAAKIQAEEPLLELAKEGTKLEHKEKSDISIKDMLQHQVNHEFENERLYLSMALWCEENGWVETAKFFSGHTLEERQHGMDFINHMLKRTMKVLTPAPAESKREYSNMREVLEDAVKREEMTSELISKLLHETIKQSDLAFHIASKYVTEQTEEEQLFNSVLNLYDSCDDSKIDFEMEINQIKQKDKYRVGDL